MANNNNRQKTLFESWNRNTGSSFGNQGGSRGLQRGGLSRQTIVKDHSTGRRGQPNRRSNRGGGRSARGNSRASTSTSEFTDGTIVIDDEDDDIICQQALGQAELAHNDVAAAFVDLNSATELPGFDEQAGSIWIYPTNCTVRSYQFDTVQTALFNNTLVSLPTGMGKTFIAAVVMYNLHRWYPQDYIVFMAPTRPLVTQQLEACHNIVGIHPSKTVELTGNILPKKREELWKSKTVFFLTPQVMISDLNRGACPFDKVRCVVVDEAHKAMGNHAYVQVISKIAEYQKQFRVLALSATPGSDMLAVQQVFKNLMISKVELRSEDSPDLLPYTHKKQIEKFVVDLGGYISSIDLKLKEIFQLYTGKLMQLKILSGKDGSSFTQYQLLKARDFFRSSNSSSSFPNYQRGYIETDFATCISLSHALELLVIHGVRSCYIFLQGICDKERGHGAVSAELRKNVHLRTLLNEIQEKLNISPENSSLNSSSSALFTTFSSGNDTSHYVPQDGKETDYSLSHPKLGVLKSIVVKHFESFRMKTETTRVMIFSQYRDSVQEIGAMLNTLRPFVKPMIFVGQGKSGAGGSGLNQKKQGEVLQDFRNGIYNVLVSTCVGEEGLNIGEVDLIICFDSSRSPTRLVQRMGRTGRQRQGKTIFLLTRGKEERTYSSSVNMQSSISKNITDVSKFQPYLYQQSPRMVPVGCDPVCYKMKIVLSSERDDYSDNFSPKDQGNGNFTKPGKLPRRAVPRKQPTKEEEKSTKSSKSACMKIDEAFKHAATKSAFSSLPFNTTVDENSEIKGQKISTETVTEREIDIDDFFIENSERDMDNHRFLCDLFEINDNSETCASCIFIPSPPKIIKPVRRSDPLTDAERDALLLNKFELQCLKENIETLALVGSRDGRCVCGNINTTCLDLCDEDFDSFSPDKCHNRNDNDVKTETTSSKSKVFKFSSKTVVRSSSNPHSIKSSATNNTNSDKNKVEMDFDADTAFAFDEDDPFFDDDDDWIDKVNEKCEANVEVERKANTSPLVNRDEENLVFISPKEPQVCFTQTEMENIFADEILFDEESDCEDDIENYQTKADTDVAKSGQIKDNGIQKAPPANILNESSTASSGMFSPFRSNQQDKKFAFRPKSCAQSTPKQVFSAVDHFTQPLVDIDNVSNHSDDLFPTSPDLSQYRLQNQIKRAKLDPDSVKTAPDNNSANILNRYVEEMRQKHSNSPAVDSAQRNESLRKSDESSEKSQLNESKPKRKFIFKKRSSTGVPEPEVTIISPVRNIESTTTVANNIPPPNVFKEYHNEPRKFVGLSRNNKVTPIVSKGDDVDKKPIPLQIETPSQKSRFNFKKPNLQTKGMENIKNEVLNYKKQYCSEDMMDTSDLDDFLQQSKERTRLKDIQEQNRRKELIEQKRLQAIQLRNSKMKQSQEHSNLNSLSIIHPIKQEKIEEVQLMTMPKNKSSQKVQQENIVSIPPTKQQHLQTAMTAPKCTNYQKRQYEFEHAKFATPSVPQTNNTMETNKRNMSKLSRKTSNTVQRSPTFQSRQSAPSVQRSPTVQSVPSFQRSPTVQKYVSVQRNEKPSSTIPCTSGFSDDDDDFDFVRPKPRLLNPAFQSPQQNLSKPLSLRQKEVKEPYTSPESPLLQAKRNARRKLPKNPFVEYEAAVSDDSSDDDAGDDDLEELDTFDDSFVTHEMDDTITNTQQARYAESVKDLIPLPINRSEKDCLLKNFDPNDSYSEYERDSFCVDNDEIHFAEVGVFTQAMNNAKSELEKEGDNSNNMKRQTRRAERLKQINAAWMEDCDKTRNDDKKKRRRVFLLEDDD